MNIYLDYLLKNFGGVHLSGAKIIGELINKYDIEHLFDAYCEYGKDNNMSKYAVERAVRHYIQAVDTNIGIEKTLKGKCFNNDRFSNKEFLMGVKLRAEECVCQENI